MLSNLSTLILTLEAASKDVNGLSEFGNIVSIATSGTTGIISGELRAAANRLAVQEHACGPCNIWVMHSLAELAPVQPHFFNLYQLFAHLLV